MATRLLVGCAVLLKVSTHSVHLGLRHSRDADSLNVVVMVIVTEAGFSVFVGEKLVFPNSAESCLTSVDWMNGENVKVFFVSHVITFRVNDCCCVML